MNTDLVDSIIRRSNWAMATERGSADHIVQSDLSVKDAQRGSKTDSPQHSYKADGLEVDQSATAPQVSFVYCLG